MKILNDSKLFKDAVEELLDLVSCTMGPYGGNVMPTAFPPVTYRDGKMVIQSYEPYDPIKLTVRNRVLALADQVVKRAGDGTTTTTLMLGKGYLKAEQLFNENPTVLRRLVADKVRGYLTEMARVLKEYAIPVIDKDGKIDQELLYAITLLSANGQETFAKGIADLVAQVGVDGEITVAPSASGLYETEVQPGYVWDRGVYEPAVVLTSGRVAWESPLVVLINDTLGHKDNVKPIMEAYHRVCQADNTLYPLVLVCKELTGAARGIFVAAQGADGKRLPIYPVHADSLYTDDFFEDLAALTGAKIIADRSGNLPRGFDSTYFGRAKRVILTPYRTVLVSKEEQQQEIDAMVEKLTSLIGEMADADRIAGMKKRISRLMGKSGIVRIPNHTTSMTSWVKEVNEDAYLAALSALKYGALPGCGAALVQVFTEVVPRRQLSKADTLAYEITKEIAYSVAAKVFANAGWIEKEIGVKLENAIQEEYLLANWTFKLVLPTSPDEEVQVVDAMKVKVLDSAYALISALEVVADELHLWMETKKYITQ